MTYQDYLNNWEQNYGDSDTGEYGYFENGRHIPVGVHRLSEAEFNLHNDALIESQKYFDAAHNDGNLTAMTNALAMSFPHEIQLLV